MNYWTVLKYALMLLFAVILIGAVIMAQDDTPSTNQPVPQASQSKFNI